MESSIRSWFLGSFFGVTILVLSASCASTVDEFFSEGGAGGESSDDGPSTGRGATATQSVSGPGATSTKGPGPTATTPAATTPATTAPAVTTVAESSSSAIANCFDDGKCELTLGEICGACADCVVGSAHCGGCFENGTCTEDDACTCVDCEGADVCPETACTSDGICEYFTEGCVCADCANTPFC